MTTYDHIKRSKYKNNFATGYVSNWSEDGFVMKKVKKYCFVDKYH